MNPYHFTDPRGKKRKRPRPRGSRFVRVIDVEQMSPRQLRAFVQSLDDSPTLTAWARKLFPERPIGFVRIARTLYAMARARISGDDIHFERLYHSLPPWQRWNRKMDPNRFKNQPDAESS